MTGKLIAMALAEAFIRSAMETNAIVRQMEAEGRTEWTEEERARIRAATDTAQAAAHEAVSQL